jgi:hypothetical protein
MADEKIIKIVAQVDSNQGPSPDDQQKQILIAARAAAQAHQAAQQAAAARHQSLLGPPVPGAGQAGRRGRPPRTNVPPPPPRGTAGPPPIQGGANNPNNPNSPVSPAGQSRFAKAWQIFQKGVTAVNGANGHLTKTVAFVTRGFQFANQSIKDLKASGITASGALGAVKNSAAAGAVRMGAASASAAKLGALAGTAALTLGAAGIAAAAMAVKIGVTVAALKILISVTDNLSEVVGKFSASLEAARANNKVLEIQTRMRSANRIGGELGSLESSKGAAERAIIDFKTSFIDLVSPFIKVALDFFTNMLKNINIILALLNVISNVIEYGVEKILEILSYIPGIGLVAKKALAWMQQDEINNIKAAKGLHDQVENLFKEENFFPTKPKKNTVAGKFLP